jgi:hypothetical protein
MMVAHGTVRAAVTEQGVFRRLCARDESLSGRPTRVLVITNANRQPDGVVSDFKCVCCRRDQRDVASSDDDACETRGQGRPPGPQSSSIAAAELGGTRQAGTGQAKDQPVENRPAIIETVTVKEVAVG